MELLKSKLNLKNSKQLLIIAGIFVAALVTIYIAYTAAGRSNISLSNPDSEPGAANPSCLLNLTLNSPPPSPTPTATPVVNLACNSVCTATSQCATGMTCLINTGATSGYCRNINCTNKTNCVCSTPTPSPKPTPTKTPSSVCRVSFDLPDTAVCWPNPINNVPITYTVHSLPTTGGPFYMQTDWYVAAPSAGPNHYLSNQLIESGKTYTMYANWPGVTGNVTTEIHAGLNVVDKNGNLLNPNCTGGMDYYWTPFVKCSTPTPTPNVSCTNWGVDETSGTGSRIVKINSTLSTVTTAKNHLCSSGYCEIESMDYDQNSKALYVVPNVAPTKGLYKVNTNTTDAIADGSLTLFKAFSPAFDVNGLAFKKSDPTKVWLWRNGYGLYNMNLSTGATTLEYSSTNEVESIDWDNNSQYLYLSSSSRANNYNGPYNMWRYNPSVTTNKITLFSNAMPGTTHSMDFAPTSYLNGNLIGYNEKPGNNLYTYNVATKSVVTNYPALNVNLDAFAACVPN